MAAGQTSTRMAMKASAWALLPYLAFNLSLIAFHQGSIIHMSKLEWTIWTAVSSLILWVGSTLILAVSAIVARNKLWLSAFLALAVFVAIAAALEPDFWNYLLDYRDNGLGYWVFVTGVLATVSFLVVGRWKAASADR